MVVPLCLIKDALPVIAQGFETVVRERRALRLETHVHVTLERLPQVVQAVLRQLGLAVAAFVVVCPLEDLDAPELMEHGDGVGRDAAVGLVEVDGVSAGGKEVVPGGGAHVEVHGRRDDTDGDVLGRGNCPCQRVLSWEES